MNYMDRIGVASEYDGYGRYNPGNSILRPGLCPCISYSVCYSCYPTDPCKDEARDADSSPGQRRPMSRKYK